MPLFLALLSDFLLLPQTEAVLTQHAPLPGDGALLQAPFSKKGAGHERTGQVQEEPLMPPRPRRHRDMDPGLAHRLWHHHHRHHNRTGSFAQTVAERPYFANSSALLAVVLLCVLMFGVVMLVSTFRRRQARIPYITGEMRLSDSLRDEDPKIGSMGAKSEGICAPLHSTRSMKAASEAERLLGGRNNDFFVTIGGSKRPPGSTATAGTQAVETGVAASTDHGCPPKIPATSEQQIENHMPVQCSGIEAASRAAADVDRQLQPEEEEVVHFCPERPPVPLCLNPLSPPVAGN